MDAMYSLSWKGGLGCQHPGKLMPCHMQDCKTGNHSRFKSRLKDVPTMHCPRPQEAIPIACSYSSEFLVVHLVLPCPAALRPIFLPRVLGVLFQPPRLATNPLPWAGLPNGDLVGRHGSHYAMPVGGRGLMTVTVTLAQLRPSRLTYDCQIGCAATLVVVVVVVVMMMMMIIMINRHIQKRADPTVPSESPHAPSGSSFRRHFA